MYFTLLDESVESIKVLNKDTIGLMRQLKKETVNENIYKSEEFPLGV